MQNLNKKWAVLFAHFYFQVQVKPNSARHLFNSCIYSGVIIILDGIWS